MNIQNCNNSEYVTIVSPPFYRPEGGPSSKEGSRLILTSIRIIMHSYTFFNFNVYFLHSFFYFIQFSVKLKKLFLRKCHISHAKHTGKTKNRKTAD